MSIRTVFLSGALIFLAVTASAENFRPATLTSEVFSITGEDSEYNYGLAEQDALNRASAFCAPTPAVQVNPFRHRRVGSYGAVFATAEFQCGTSSRITGLQDEAVICKKVGSTYVVKCCDRVTGTCWIE